MIPGPRHVTRASTEAGPGRAAHYHATVTEALAGGTAWQRELYTHLTAHGETEHALLDAYDQAATESESPAFRYLVSMILDEERRHHRTFAELARSLRVEVEQLREERPVPVLGHWGFQHHRIVELTDALLEQERRDADELTKLVTQLDAVGPESLWQLLVELMLVDTAKHVRILEFVKQHAARDD